MNIDDLTDEDAERLEALAEIVDSSPVGVRIHKPGENGRIYVGLEFPAILHDHETLMKLAKGELLVAVLTADQLAGEIAAAEIASRG
jgi:predicted transcriptional regulator